MPDVDEEQLEIPYLKIGLIGLFLWGLVGLVAYCSEAYANPVPGMYGNPSQSGRGYNIDYQNGKIAIAVYGYRPDGQSVWYLAAGPMTDGNTRFAGEALEMENGQCFGCPYEAPTVAKSIGTLAIVFHAWDRATLTYNGEPIEIEHSDFGFGDAPGSMLGRWYAILEDPATRDLDGLAYLFSRLAPPSGLPGGTGLFLDDGSRAAGECYDSGALAGRCLIVDLAASSDRVERAFVYDHRVNRWFGAEVDPVTGQGIASMMAMQVNAGNELARALARGVTVDHDLIGALIDVFMDQEPLQ